MFVVVAGGELTGAWLVQRLLEHEHRALLIEDRPEVLARIHRELPTEAVFHGNPASPGVLASSGIAQAQVFVTLMPDDAVNLALCYLASTLYSVPRTIAGINDPRNAWLFDRRFHVTVGVDTTDGGKAGIRDRFTSESKLGAGNVEARLLSRPAQARRRTWESP